jgi:hypothetical protein
MVLFCYTVALTAVTKAETLVFRLRGVPKKLRTVQANNFLVDSALCITARSHLYLRISREFATICKNDLNPLISGRSGID